MTQKELERYWTDRATEILWDELARRAGKINIVCLKSAQPRASPEPPTADQSKSHGQEP